MGVVFRQSIKSTIINLGGAVLGALVVLVGSNLVPMQELGFSRNLTNQSVVASFFFLFGMSSTLFLYFHRFDEEKEKEKRAVFLSFCFSVPLLLYFIFTIAYFCFQGFFLRFFQEKDIPFMRHYFLCFPLYTLFFMYINLFEAYMIAQIKTAAANMIKELMLKGINLILILLYGFNLIDYSLFIYAFVFSNLAAVLALFLLARKNENFRFSSNWKALSGKEYKEIISFSAYHAMMGISVMLMGFLDVLLIAGWDKEGLNAVPIYSNAVFISAFMLIPYRAMMYTASGDITKAYAQKNHDKVSDIYNRSGLNILIATVFMAAIIISNLHNAVSIMGPGFEAVWGVCLVLIIGKFIDGGTGMNDTALNMSPFFKINFYLSIALVISMVIALWILIPVYGAIGAAWTFSISILLFNAVKTFVVWKKMGLHPFSKGTTQTLLIGILVCTVGLLIPKIANPYYDTLMRSTIIIPLFIGLVLWIKPSKDISHYIEETLKKKRLF